MEKQEWRTVPVEPKEIGLGASYEDAAYVSGWNDCRAAMLSAAPTPPKSEPCACDVLKDRIDHLERKARCHSKYATRPIIYTDGVNGEQCCRDDLWAISTEELNRLSCDRNAVIEEIIAIADSCGYVSIESLAALKSKPADDRIAQMERDAARWNTFLRCGLISPDHFSEEVAEIIASISEESTPEEVCAAMDKIAAMQSEGGK